MEIDELPEEDKLTVHRARKLQKQLSQPFNTAEVFTGTFPENDQAQKVGVESGVATMR